MTKGINIKMVIITTINYNFDTVYNATLQAIQNGQIFDYKSNLYDISVNKNNGTYAEIDSASDSDLTDSLQVAMKKLPDNTTRISIKYGSQGNSIRSSALVGIIEEIFATLIFSILSYDSLTKKT